MSFTSLRASRNCLHPESQEGLKHIRLVARQVEDIRNAPPESQEGLKLVGMSAATSHISPESQEGLKHNQDSSHHVEA